ncbi:lytic transglycosylase domain-containing protein [Enterobacter asburiae]|uniref:lytic transglycosylase domain-containing protein n=1 Tax=Enterobacter asburiae TaxID=61645 RepID=UPI00237FD5D0|nr:lytic transglycosylase domain-containing protein [Enterobacter asburiae]MDE4034210.1 transglycosylase SLT domain-containing protein [Enterobacter asburiae]MDE4065668.1 transglycosylase SLT domain-containing protein [Enterobacter asburiae]MDE4070671.1 transglycosylase SLT domain-containing protein [Enterobacter asburiae]
MVAKSIVDIDVNDDKFVAFMEKFKEYQAALEDLPEAWRGLAHGATDATKETAKAKTEGDLLAKAFSEGASAILSINSGLERLTDSLDRANKSQEDFNKKTRSSKGFLSEATKDAKSLAGHIRDATTSLLSWGGIVGLFTGVLGVGGLFGLNRLAATTGSQRFTSLGIGTSIGALDSTAINYQKALGNPTGTLGAIRDSQMDLSKRWTFQAMGINNPDQDPAKLLPQMIRNARDIFVKNGSTLQGANAYGLTNFFSLDDLNRFKNMSDEEIDAMERRAQKDAKLLQITDQQARQWQDFNVQLDYSGQSIRNTFVRGLGPLTPQLSKLSDALAGAIDTVLQSPELGKWIDGLAGGIERFGKYLASPEFTKDVDDFMDGLRRLGQSIGRVIDLFTGKTSVSEFMAASSPMLNNQTVHDPNGGPDYVPGSESDPNVPGWLKKLKLASGVAPVQYDEYFEEAAKKYNVDPKWLKSIAAAESSWDQNAVSSAGAKGLMQVMPSNFRDGEKPFDPRDNIMAGARVFSWAMQQSGGDFDEALRYYNGGIRRGSAENVAYPGRVREQYEAMYGSQKNPAIENGSDNSEVAKNTNKTNQLLQQIVDRGLTGNGSGMVVYNNTGGNAVVSSSQLGVR